MKMWDGRFTESTSKLMEQFNNSLPVDKEFFKQDCANNRAWAGALCKCEVLTADELKKILAGLDSIEADASESKLVFLPSDEDIHMALERILIERIGDVGAKLHTGRSRNDQVVTDFRLYVMEACSSLQTCIGALQRALVLRATSDESVILPGFTHLQQAQPVLLSHYWMSFYSALNRECDRFMQTASRADYMPLGAGAIAGCGFEIDRHALAQTLGFSKPTDNSMDAVASRDFALDFLSSCANTAIVLSRYAEDLIIWSSKEFSFVTLSDAFSTGSSMMPQKKNPDSLELIRGKCGRFIGNYTRLAVTLKGVGLTYYKDLQEDKEPVFDSFKQLSLVVQVFSQVIATLSVNQDRMAADMDPLLFATDVADYLVVKGLPFRQAHKVVGKLVGMCVTEKIDLGRIPLARLVEFSPLFTDDVYALFSAEAALAHRAVYGGTARHRVQEQIKAAQAKLGIV